MIHPFRFIVDGGGSGTRVELRDSQGSILAHCEGGPSALSRGGVAGASVINQLWENVAIEAVPAESATLAKQTHALIAISGLPISDECERMERLLPEFGRLEMVSDGLLGLYAAFECAPGAILAIGTGVSAQALIANADGSMSLQSFAGWGFPAGDEGSGAWLGLKLVQAIMRHADQLSLPAQPTPELLEQAAKIIGTGPDMIAWSVYATAADYGELVPLLLEADRVSDPLACHTVGRAVELLTELALRLCSDGIPELAIAGGLGHTLRHRIEASARASRPDLKFHDFAGSLMDGGNHILANPNLPRIAQR